MQPWDDLQEVRHNGDTDWVGALWQRKPHRSRKREKTSRLGRDSEPEVQGEWQVGLYPWERMKGARQGYDVWIKK